MKKKGHPEYRKVLFKDSSTGESILCGSTWIGAETEKDKDGNEVPVCAVPISSLSHPFYSGSERLIDTEGRVDRFKKRYAAAAEKSKKAEAPAEPEKKPRKKRAATKKKTT